MNVLLLDLTNLFYRYTKNEAHKCRSTIEQKASFASKSVIFFLHIPIGKAKSSNIYVY